MLISHGGTMAFEEQKPVLVSDFDFEGVDARLDAGSSEEAEMLALDDFNHERARRAAARHLKKSSCGRRGLPEDIVRQMFRDYQRLGSLARVARIYKRSRQAMWEIFKAHGLKMNERQFHAVILFGGKKWTPGKNGTYRETGERSRPQLLHRAIWEACNGCSVPAGWQVTFKDGDNTNISTKNLVALPMNEVVLLHYHRRYKERAGFSAQQLREFWKKYYRDLMRKKMAAFVASGLRTDGKPRLRLDVAHITRKMLKRQIGSRGQRTIPLDPAGSPMGRAEYILKP